MLSRRDVCAYINLQLPPTNARWLWMKLSLWLLHYHSCEILRRSIKRRIMSFVKMVQCVCVCVYTNCSTHTNNKHGRVLSWLHDRLPFMHASAWYIIVLHPFWSYIISNTFQCVWTPTPFCCTLFFSTHIYMCFSFNKVNWAVLVAAVPRFG